MQTQHLLSDARAAALMLCFASTPFVAGCGDDDSNGDTHGGTSTDTEDGTTAPTTASAGDTEPVDETTGATVDPDGSTSGAGDTDPGEESSSGETGNDELEIIGEWIEPFPGGMTTHVITSESWTQTISDFGSFGYDIEAFDNAARWVVGRDQDDRSYSRFDWTWEDDALHYCTSAFGLATVEDALAAPMADESDLDGGCSGFPWSALEPG